jgi:hypothetical protein
MTTSTLPARRPARAGRRGAPPASVAPTPTGSGGDVVLRLHLAPEAADRAGTDALEVGDVLRQLVTDLVPGVRADLDVDLVGRPGPAPLPRPAAPVEPEGPAALAARDLELLLLLVRAQGRPVPRATAARELWGSDEPAAEALLAAHVGRLRALLPARGGVLDDAADGLRFRAA